MKFTPPHGNNSSNVFPNFRRDQPKDANCRAVSDIHTDKLVTNQEHIPGHAGIRYNERADRLAGNAVPFGELEMTAADVVCALITAAWEKAEHDEHTWSMERLRLCSHQTDSPEELK
jgi:hypothetical protein